MKQMRKILIKGDKSPPQTAAAEPAKHRFAQSIGYPQVKLLWLGIIACLLTFFFLLQLVVYQLELATIAAPAHSGQHANLVRLNQVRIDGAKESLKNHPPGQYKNGSRSSETYVFYSVRDADASRAVDSGSGAGHYLRAVADVRTVPNTGAQSKNDQFFWYGATLAALLAVMSIAWYGIRERKRHDVALLESESRYRVFFESNPLPLWVYDLDSLRFLDVNDIACARYGYTREEFRAMTIRDIRPVEDIAALEQRVASARGTVVGSGPWRHLRKNGSVIMVEINSHNLFIHGQRARVVCPLDVTDRVHAEDEVRRMTLQLEHEVKLRTDELARSLALQQSLFDSAPQLFWLADPDGSVTFVNLKWSEKIGIAANDWKGDGWSKLLHPDDCERVSQAWLDATSTKTVFDIEYRFLHRDGYFHPYHVTARKVFDVAGAPICWVGICSDITESRRREDELQFANRELEAFSASVSHDLRAPLRMIDGYSKRLQIEATDRLDEQGRHFLARIRKAAADMSELIDDLLSLSQLAKANMTVRSISLSALAHEVVAEFRQQEPHRAMEIVIQDGMGAYGDAHLLRIVLVNLIGNAIKFSSNREVSRIEVGESNRTGGSATYFVRDNGAGFDPTYSSKMFGVFQRLHSATEFPGTGIGLATVQRIIQRHGGSVSALGAVNEGATIYFTLPSV